MKHSRTLDKGKHGHLDDWYGNNIGFNCPVCGKVYIVSGQHHKEGRLCPNCGKSRGSVDVHGQTASIEWDVDSSLFLKAIMS